MYELSDTLAQRQNETNQEIYNMLAQANDIMDEVFDKFNGTFNDSTEAEQLIWNASASVFEALAHFHDRGYRSKNVELPDYMKVDLTWMEVR